MEDILGRILGIYNYIIPNTFTTHPKQAKVLAVVNTFVDFFSLNDTDYKIIAILLEKQAGWVNDFASLLELNVGQAAQSLEKLEKKEIISQIETNKIEGKLRVHLVNRMGQGNVDKIKFYVLSEKGRKVFSVMRNELVELIPHQAWMQVMAFNRGIRDQFGNQELDTESVDLFAERTPTGLIKKHFCTGCNKGFKPIDLIVANKVEYNGKIFSKAHKFCKACYEKGSGLTWTILDKGESKGEQADCFKA